MQHSTQQPTYKVTPEVPNDKTPPSKISPSKSLPQPQIHNSFFVCPPVLPMRPRQHQPTKEYTDFAVYSIHDQNTHDRLKQKIIESQNHRRLQMKWTALNAWTFELAFHRTVWNSDSLVITLRRNKILFVNFFYLQFSYTLLVFMRYIVKSACGHLSPAFRRFYVIVHAEML